MGTRSEFYSKVWHGRSEYVTKKAGMTERIGGSRKMLGHEGRADDRETDKGK